MSGMRALAAAGGFTGKALDGCVSSGDAAVQSMAQRA